MNEIVVILSVYKNDTRAQLQEAMESLYRQTLNAFDIFVQCDGVISLKVEEFLESEYKLKKIKYLGKRVENKGLAYSLNELISLGLESGYEYFMRMDADDISDTKRVEKQYLYMKKHLDVDICGTLIEEFNTDTKERQVVRYPQHHQEILAGMKKRNSVAHVTTFIRKSFFEKAGLYDVTLFNEDFELWLRGLKKGCKFYNVQEVLVYVRTSNAFFQRRKDFQRALEVMRLKWEATSYFHFGFMGYFYAIAHFGLFLFPNNLKSFIYKTMR